MAPHPEQAFLEQLLHAHMAEDAFFHEAEDQDADDE
jgi:hypothetical protein